MSFLLNSVFSKEMGGPEKGRWGFIALKRAVFLLETSIAAVRASSGRMAMCLHLYNASATGRSGSTLCAHHG